MQHVRQLLILLLCAAMLLAAVGCGAKKPEDQNKPKQGDYEMETELNAVAYGCDNTGETDVTDLMIALHEEAAEKKKKVYYPNGTYLFNGETLNFDGGVRFESLDGVLIRNSISDVPIINFDDFGNLIGLMQNHLEGKYDSKDGADGTLNGNLVSPPLSTAQYETVADLVPFWYNDFGKYSTYNGGHGWKGWYDWQWNHHDCENLGTEESPYDPYDPTRHPLLGWYHGDDPVVLDWQCYWLQEYGVKNTILLSSPHSAWWKDNVDANNWAYQLMNNTPNAKQMKFAFNPGTGNGEENLDPAWYGLFNTVYFPDEYKDMIYCIEKNGKRYPVIYLWAETAVTGLLSWKDYYAKAADAMKDHGYDGICIMVSQAKTHEESVKAELLERDVLRLIVYYNGNDTVHSATYGLHVDSFIPHTNSNVVFGVNTGSHTHDPHPSQWVEPGYNPTDFGRWIAKCVSAIQGGDFEKIITCYNVSEWSEGGPGLVPTVADRFAYLEAIRDNTVKK